MLSLKEKTTLVYFQIKIFKKPDKGNPYHEKEILFLDDNAASFWKNVLSKIPEKEPDPIEIKLVFQEKIGIRDAYSQLSDTSEQLGTVAPRGEFRHHRNWE